MKTALFTGIGFAALAIATAGSVHASDDYCREYQRRVTIGGKVQDSYGTACLQPDGSWKIVGEGDARVVGTTYPVTTEQPVYYVENEPVVIYEEPLYVSRRIRYDRYDPTPVWWGVNLSFNDNHGWRDRNWHDHGSRGHGGHGRGHDRH